MENNSQLEAEEIPVPKISQVEVFREQYRISQAEIMELKGSLKYVEVKLGHANEEKEKIQNKLDEKQHELATVQ